MSHTDKSQSLESNHGECQRVKCGEKAESVCSVDGSPYCKMCFLRALEGQKSE